MLAPSDFRAFFKEVNGYDPFPWQQRLLEHVAEKGIWPGVLDLPTGAGKTAAIDIAVFHLALECERGSTRRAPIRIAFVVDRRLVVDDAYNRAKKIAAELGEPKGPITTQVAECLRKLSGGEEPLVVRRLRGGMPREDDWARTPSQPTILCSTVDQVGSRLLFRGYGVSDSMKPVHAGLLGSDCLILLDEAHLAEPFRQTLEWIRLYRGERWRESRELAPWGVSLLTATPGVDAQDSFSLLHDDRENPILKERLSASKLARLVLVAKSNRARDAQNENDQDAEDGAKDLPNRVAAIVDEVKSSLKHFENGERGTAAPAIGIVVNRVARARAVFERLNEELEAEINTGQMDEPVLMIGPARPVDRDELTAILEPIHTRTPVGHKRQLSRPLIVVSTQCIEAGVDIDLDALITELAPLDALRQRFGRLNRAGRDIVPYASLVVTKSDVSSKHVDPVYEKALKPAWEALQEAETSDKKVEFGISNFAVTLREDALSPKADAPVLLPAHLDLLSQTSPIPAADPDLSLYLHGPNRQPEAVTVVWRADIDPAAHEDENIRRLLTLVPPRSGEAIELPAWAVRRWLEGRATSANQIADIAMSEVEDSGNFTVRGPRTVFLWKGDDERSRWVSPARIRPGDTLVVPAIYGGVDRFGWNPERGRRDAITGNGVRPATDAGQRAAAAYARRHFVVRVAPGLVDHSLDELLAESLARTPSRRWKDLRDAVLELPVPESLREDLKLLDRAKAKRVSAYLDLYGQDEEGRPKGIVFVAPFGIKEEAEAVISPIESDSSNSTENDSTGSLPGFPLTLDRHNQDVGEFAGRYATAAGLSEIRIKDLKCAGYMHDLGKADARFQAWLHFDDPLGPDLDQADQLLAKSARPLPRRARTASELPDHWRHEANSVRRAFQHKQFSDASDPELVLWLVGVHHGYGRPFFPHCDPTETYPNVGPQSLGFDWCGLDWSSMFVRLKQRYGVWELARMEAILRLADHRASEMRQHEAASL